MACSKIVGRMRMTAVGRFAEPVKGCRGVFLVFQQLMTKKVLCVMTVPRGSVKVRQVIVKVLKVSIGVGS